MLNQAANDSDDTITRDMTWFFQERFLDDHFRAWFLLTYGVAWDVKHPDIVFTIVRELYWAEFSKHGVPWDYPLRQPDGSLRFLDRKSMKMCDCVVPGESDE